MTRLGRAAVVLAGAVAIGAFAAFTLDPWRGISLGFFALPLLTLLTIPSDLHPGEYDVFGFVILALILVVGLAAWVMDERPTIRWDKYDNPPPATAWPD